MGNTIKEAKEIWRIINTYLKSEFYQSRKSKIWMNFVRYTTSKVKLR